MVVPIGVTLSEPILDDQRAIAPALPVERWQKSHGSPHPVVDGLAMIDVTSLMFRARRCRFRGTASTEFLSRSESGRRSGRFGGRLGGLFGSALTSWATTAKPAAGIAGARGLDGRIQRQQVGLFRRSPGSG